MSQTVEGQSQGMGWLSDFQRCVSVWRRVVGVAGAAMCHDLNNPLQGVVGFADLLVQTATGDVKDDLQLILDGGVACRTLADEFGSLAETYGPQPEDVSLRQIVGWVLFSSIPEDRWEVEIPEGLDVLRVDQVYLALILQGLCSCPPGTCRKASFEASKGPDGVVLRCELEVIEPVADESGPKSIDYWLGRRAARLVGGSMERRVSADAIVCQAHLGDIAVS